MVQTLPGTDLHGLHISSNTLISHFLKCRVGSLPSRVTPSYKLRSMTSGRDWEQSRRSKEKKRAELQNTSNFPIFSVKCQNYIRSIQVFRYLLLLTHGLVLGKRKMCLVLQQCSRLKQASCSFSLCLLAEFQCTLCVAVYVFWPLLCAGYKQQGADKVWTWNLHGNGEEENIWRPRLRPCSKAKLVAENILISIQ